MLTAFVLALLPQPVALSTLRLDRARELQGQFVLARFVIAKPHFTLKNRTVIGAADRTDGIERTAVVRGIRRDLDTGRRVSVPGILRVLDHETATVNGVSVPTWTEIRVQNAP